MVNGPVTVRDRRESEPRMTISSLPAPLGGIVPPIVTPLAGDGSLDVGGLERLVEHLVAGGVHGLFALGSTGEGPSLSQQVRGEMVRALCRCVRGRLPVLIGVTDASLAESIELAKRCGDEGADAVVMAPPYYFPLGQSDLVRFAVALTQQSPVPVVLYNMPALTKTSFSPETVGRLAQEPSIIGFKDSSGDLEYFRKVRACVAGRVDWGLLVGPENLLGAALAVGATGGVCGGANVLPRLFVSLFEAATAGDADGVAACERRIGLLGRLHQLGQNPGIAVPQGVKAALAEMGVCGDVMAAPFLPLEASQRNRVREILEELAVALPAEEPRRAGVLSTP